MPTEDDPVKRWRKLRHGLLIDEHLVEVFIFLEERGHPPILLAGGRSELTALEAASQQLGRLQRSADRRIDKLKKARAE